MLSNRSPNSEPNPSRSGYRSLPSSGRLEEDLLDRLQNALQVQATTLPLGLATEQSTAPWSRQFPPTAANLAPANLASRGDN